MVVKIQSFDFQGGILQVKFRLQKPLPLLKDFKGVC
jgi:hypothetical protein